MSINKIGLAYAQLLNKKQYYSQTFDGINERPVEYEFLFRHLAQQAPETVLDVGTGLTALPHLMRSCGFVVTAIDNIEDYWPNGMVNHHYFIINDDITRTRLKIKFDFITCISVLEHIKNHRAAVKSMFSLLNPGGHIILSFPYNEKAYAENVYKLPSSTVRELPPFVTQAYSRREVNAWLAENEGTIVEQEYWRFSMGEYWSCGEMLRPPLRVGKDELHQISCIAIQNKLR